MTDFLGKSESLLTNINPSKSISTPATGGTGFKTIINDIEFSSCFDSGNMNNVEYDASSDTYLIWIAKDCFDTEYEANFSLWYYFSVKPLKSAGRKIKVGNYD